jgi:hypothetical protein
LTEDTSNVEQIDDVIVRLAALVYDEAPGTPLSLTVDFQQSGEHPYRVSLVEETLPWIGLARGPARPADNTDS